MGPNSAIKVAHHYLRKLIASAAEKEVERFFRAFLKNTPFSGKTHAVGGYVRDQYRSILKNDPSIEPKDLDIVIEMDGGAEKITHFLKDKFKDSISTPVHMGNYPIWQLTFKDDIEYRNETYNTKGAVIEFADTMEEEFPDEESRQRKVKYGPLKKDIERRDFTINMLLKDLTTGEIKDLTGLSKRDIEKGLLRHVTLEMLDERFKEDPLRIIRLARFAAIYDLDIPRSVLRVAKKNAERIKIISEERVRRELEKVMKVGKTKKAIQVLKATGILKLKLPEVQALIGIQQGEKYHQEGDVYRHTLKVLENAKPGIENQMAALLHDIGKPATQRILPDKITFYEHQDAGAEIARAIMKRLKFDKKTTDKVVALVKKHMDPLTKKDISDKNLRKYIREVGDETVDSILDLARADELGRLPPKNEIPNLIERVKKIREAPVKMKKEPILNGKEIMELLNLKQGPKIGEVKDYLLDLQDEYASKDKKLTKTEAKKLLRKKFL